MVDVGGGVLEVGKSRIWDEHRSPSAEIQGEDMEGHVVVGSNGSFAKVSLRVVGEPNGVAEIGGGGDANGNYLR